MDHTTATNRVTAHSAVSRHEPERKVDPRPHELADEECWLCGDPTCDSTPCKVYGPSFEVES